MTKSLEPALKITQPRKAMLEQQDGSGVEEGTDGVDRGLEVFCSLKALYPKRPIRESP